MHFISCHNQQNDDPSLEIAASIDAEGSIRSLRSQHDSARRFVSGQFAVDAKHAQKDDDRWRHAGQGDYSSSSQFANDFDHDPNVNHTGDFIHDLCGTFAKRRVSDPRSKRPYANVFTETEKFQIVKSRDGKHRNHTGDFIHDSWRTFAERRVSAPRSMRPYASVFTEAEKFQIVESRDGKQNFLAKRTRDNEVHMEDRPESDYFQMDDESL